MTDENEEYYHEEEDEYEEEDIEYTGIMALLHDEEKEPHVHLAILLILTFVVAAVVKIIGL